MTIAVDCRLCSVPEQSHDHSGHSTRARYCSGWSASGFYGSGAVGFSHHKPHSAPAADILQAEALQGQFYLCHHLPVLS